MKTIQIILLTICFTFGFCNNNNAQDSTEQTTRFVEQTINGQTYVYDTFMRIIKNKKNHIYTIKENHHCDFRVGDIRPSLDVAFNKTFSEERKKELKGVTFPMHFYCDSLGNIVEVDFRYKDISTITLQEINALENELLEYKVEIRHPCPENKYYFLAAIYRWPQERWSPERSETD